MASKGYEKQCVGYGQPCGRTFVARKRETRYGPCCLRAARIQGKELRWTPEMDAVIREKYNGRRGCVQVVVKALGWPEGRKWAIRARARDLGLLWPKSVRPWTKAEDEQLEQWAGVRSTRWISKRLRRSRGSIIHRAKHLQISCAIREGYTLKDLTACFGMSLMTVQRWVREGRIKGQRVASGTSEPGVFHDRWQFSDAQVLKFLREHPTQYRLDRVDQTWFLDLVFGGRLGEKVA